MCIPEVIMKSMNLKVPGRTVCLFKQVMSSMTFPNVLFTVCLWILYCVNWENTTQSVI